MKRCDIILEKKYVITKNGNLHLLEVSSASETELGYWCQVRNKITGQTFLSRAAGRIKLTDPQGGTAPTITDILPEVSIETGEIVKLACASQGYPPPAYIWMSGDSELSKNSTVFVRGIEPGTSVYTCIVENRFGSDKADTKVIVRGLLPRYNF